MGSTSAWNKKHYCLHVKVVEANLSFQLLSSLAGLRPEDQRHSGRSRRPRCRPRELVNVADCEALWKQLMPISQCESDSSVAKSGTVLHWCFKLVVGAEIPMAKYTSKTQEIDLNWLQGAKKTNKLQFVGQKMSLLVRTFSHLFAALSSLLPR